MVVLVARIYLRGGGLLRASQLINQSIICHHKFIGQIFCWSLNKIEKELLLSCAKELLSNQSQRFEREGWEIIEIKKKLKKLLVWEVCMLSATPHHKLQGLRDAKLWSTPFLNFQKP